MPQTPILRQKYEYNVRQKYIVYAKKNTKYAKQNTKYAKWNIKYAKRITKHAKQNTKYANQNTKYAKHQVRNFNQKGTPKNKHWFKLFCHDAIFVANLRTFLAYLLQA